MYYFCLNRKKEVCESLGDIKKAQEKDAKPKSQFLFQIFCYVAVGQKMKQTQNTRIIKTCNFLKLRGDPEKCLIRLFCVHLIACSHTLIQAPGTDDEEHTGD